MSRIDFDLFPKVAGGNDCPGADIVVDGVRVGFIARTFDFVDVGTTSARYRNVVTGYRVCLFGNATPFAFESFPEIADEHVFATLAEARSCVRAVLEVFDACAKG